MDSTVVYSEVKMSDTKEDPAPGVKIQGTHKSDARPKLQSFSKLTLTLGLAVLFLLMTIVGMTIKVVRLQKQHSCAGSPSQAGQHVYNLSSNEHVDQTLSKNHPRYCGYCSKGWLLHRGLCYLLSSTEQNSTAAAISCSSTCSQLAHAKDSETLAFLRQHMDTKFYWIGLNKTKNGSTWLWNGGAMLNLTHYFNNTNHLDKDCAIISKTLIYAEECNRMRGYICEKKASCGP